ncbi:MAG TPA: response regulator [Oscillatoriaceae cyanobacterium]
MAHILIVEDDPVNAEVAAVICEGAGHTVSLARHGEEALVCMARERFDLLLVDVQMPVMDGLELTRRVRSSSMWAALPLIGVTAKASQADRHAMWEAGMTEIVTKPYRNQVLRDAIASVLARPIQDAQASGGGPARV